MQPIENDVYEITPLISEAKSLVHREPEIEVIGKSFSPLK